jgi:hypothetical protein
MDIYHVWFDLAPGARDTEAVAACTQFCERLRDRGLAGYRITRRKLGLGPSELGEFHLLLEFEGLAALDSAFAAVAARSEPIEGLHHAVNGRVRNTRFALYRDFPDAVRVHGAERFRAGAPRAQDACCALPRWNRATQGRAAPRRGAPRPAGTSMSGSLRKMGASARSARSARMSSPARQGCGGRQAPGSARAAPPRQAASGNTRAALSQKILRMADVAIGCRSSASMPAGHVPSACG